EYPRQEPENGGIPASHIRTAGKGSGHQGRERYYYQGHHQEGKERYGVPSRADTPAHKTTEELTQSLFAADKSRQKDSSNCRPPAREPKQEGRRQGMDIPFERQEV